MPRRTFGDDELRRALGPVPPEFEQRPGLRQAAVLAPWFTRDGHDWLLFVQRRPDLRHHAGQVAFPGGGREGDESPAECALREFEEETGLPHDEVELLGALPTRTSVASFRVIPLVGRIPPPRIVVPDGAEISCILEVPFGALADARRWHERVGTGSRRRSPHFDHGPHVLWGLTARFTLDLVERLTS